jgi:transposase
MSEGPVWAGLDVGETSCQIAVIGEDDALVAEATLHPEVEAVAAFFKSIGDFALSQIAVESGATAVHLVRGLRKQGLPVVIYEARRASHYLRLRVNKTDVNDARGLAEIARMARSSLTQVHLKSPKFQKLRSDLVFRHKLTLHRVACEGMIRSRIILNGGQPPRVTSLSTLDEKVRSELRRMKCEMEIDLIDDLEPLLAFAISLRRFLTSLERRFKAIAKKDPVCSRLMTIPGVGPICALSFYTAVEDPNRFANAVDVGPYLGLAAVVNQSGQSKRYGRISRRGNKMTRAHLTLAAGSVLYRCGESPLQSWGKAVAARRGKGKAQVAVARKLAILMLTIWRSGTRYDPERAGWQRDKGEGS